MTESANDGVWRDDHRLPLAELSRAVATSSADGQVDDATGGDAGSELEFGDHPFVEDAEVDPGSGDPDPDTEEGRRLRPSPLGRIGPM
jgi:hypothetical protein